MAPLEPACPDDLAPVRDVIGVSYYADASKSVVDPERREAEDRAMRPVWRFVQRVGEITDEGGDASQDCALGLLAAWARADALLGEVNQQGGYGRVGALGGLSLAFERLQGARARSPEADRAVSDWLRRVALAVQPDFQRPQRKDNRNNHAYWGGLAVAATGEAIGDRGLVAWGLGKASLGIAQVRPDGTLPLEMTRGPRALHYQLYALTPLVMLAEIGMRHGVDLYATRGGALRRLAARSLAGLDDPGWFARRAGAPQDVPDHLPPEDVAWMEPYHARFGDAGLVPWLERVRPVRSTRLGGDVTVRFAPPRTS